jgi:hypothetical protein
VSFRQSVFDEFAGDLEYHPRRAIVYLVLAAAACSFWFFSPAENKFTLTPLVFGLGSLTLLFKGVFLLRKSSEGLGLTQHDLDALSSTAARKELPQLLQQAAQVVQDFGAGSMLLWPLLNMGKDIDVSWTDPPRSAVFICGAALFGLGWLIRRLTRTHPSP